ncbi:MAG: serine--tRNA ligase [Terracidiphilus sp.]|jgi:seryl-tRNA synthetase
MLDLGFVRANLELVEEKLRARGADPAALLGDFRALDKSRREAITQSEQLKARRNELSQQVGALIMKNRKAAADPNFAGRSAREKIAISVSDTKERLATPEVAALQDEIRALKDKLEEQDFKANVLDDQLRQVLARVPNLVRDDVPVGVSEADNKTVKTWGERHNFDFEPKPHWELGEALGILDLERAAKLSGARFAVYMGAGARLERALISFMLDMHTQKHGYTEVLPPFMVNADSMFGTGQLPKFEQDLFKIPLDDFEPNSHHIPKISEEVLAQGQNGLFRVKGFRDGGVEITLIGAEHYSIVVPRGVLSFKRSFYLIPTAEVPVTNLYRDEILDEARLPISLTAYTPCFRAEAGAAGKDTRGIIRQHQFQKVELVKFTRPEESDAEHEKLTRNAEEILEALELPYRRVLLCTGDTGFSSAKTYDLEVWLPGQNLYREISSCSNFDAFQARRANIRYRPSGPKAKPEFVHTLNGSGLAVGRTWLAILENYQRADGSVEIPQALRAYMGGLDRIMKES